MYNNNYYVRDTKRNVVTTEMHLPPKIALERGVPELSDGRPTSAMGKPDETQGSPGNKNSAVLDYDPSGLRSAMSATQEELDKSLATCVAARRLPQLRAPLSSKSPPPPRSYRGSHASAGDAAAPPRSRSAAGGARGTRDAWRRTSPSAFRRRPSLSTRPVMNLSSHLTAPALRDARDGGRRHRYMPDHLPTYPWEDPEVQAKAIADWEAKGLPPTPGLAFKWKVPKVARENHW